MCHPKATGRPCGLRPIRVRSAGFTRLTDSSCPPPLTGKAPIRYHTSPLRKPPAMIAARAVQLPNSCDAVFMHHVVTACCHTVAKERYDGAAVVAAERLHLSIHLGSQAIVHLRFGLQ